MAKHPSLASCLEATENVVFRELQGELVLLNLDSGVYFGLNQMGTRIWQLLQERVTLQTVLDRLCQEYDVPETTCREDLLSFAAATIEKGLLKVRDGTSA